MNIDGSAKGDTMHDMQRRLVDIYARLDMLGVEMSFQLLDVGSRLMIEQGASIALTPGRFSNIFVGRGSYADGDTVMLSPGLIIGRYCSISHYVSLGATQHRTHWLGTGKLPTNPTIQEPATFDDDTVIGNDVWLGRGAIVLGGKGIVIGHGAIIGAGAVVTKSVPPYAVAVGNPARILRLRFDEAIVEALLKSRWWALPEEIIATLPYDDVTACLERLAEITPPPCRGS